MGAGRLWEERMQKGQNLVGNAEAHAPELLLSSLSRGAAELGLDVTHFMHMSSPAQRGDERRDSGDRSWL